MHDQRLRLEHLYEDPIVRNKLYHYDLNHQLPNESSTHNFRIQTHKINLLPDYDLPLKQLQFTQTRQYKQNLNPIFQQLSTTHDRYSYSKQWNQNGKNDDLPVSDRQCHHKSKKYPKNHNPKAKRQEAKGQQIFRQEKLRVKQLKERSRILSENVKRGQRGQRQIFKFGEASNHNKKKQRQDKNNNTAILPEHDTSMKIINTLIESQDTEQLSSEQLAKVYLSKMRAKTEQLQTCLKQSQQKISMLRQQVQMHKEKSLIKQRQLFYLSQQTQTILSKSKQLSQSLKQHSQTYIQTQKQHNQVSKKLRLEKLELKKEKSWLEEQNNEIRGINGKIEQLLRLIRSAEEEQDQQQEFMRELQEQQSLNEKLNHQLAQSQQAVLSLTEQTLLIEEETNTLQIHLTQLQALEQKFQQQTYTLLSTIDELNQQIADKHQFIEQQPEIDQLIRQVELEIGQISQKKIILQQEIHQINVKISLKKRNINYIQQSLPQRQTQTINFGKKYHLHQHYHETTGNPHITYNDQPRYNNQFSFTSLGDQNLNINSNLTTLKNNPFPKHATNTNNKQPLPTIRQQSKNTSAYQSPKLSQDLRQPPQHSPERYQTKEQPIKHLQSQSLQIDSRMISQTEIMKSHQEEMSPQKQKKYFVIESEDDAGMTSSKSAFAYAKSYLQRQNHPHIHQNNSEQLFIEKKKKPSIEHRLYELEPSVLRTQNQLQQQNNKQFQAELQSSNYFLSANNRLQSQESEFPVVKLPPKSNDQKYSKRDKVQDRSPKTKPYSNNHKHRNDDSPNESIQQSEDVFESLIEQYQHIKSNSCFQESWKHKI